MKPWVSLAPVLGIALLTSSCLTGLEGTDAGYPPDCNIAVGPNHIVEVTNGSTRVFTKGNAIVASVSTQTFMGCANYGGDPKIIYDWAAGRWMIVSIGLGYDNFPTTLVGTWCLAVSSNSDPTQAWRAYEFSTGAFGEFPDFPKIATADDKIVLTGNFSGQTGTPGGATWVINKADVLNGVAAHGSLFFPDAAETMWYAAPSVGTGYDGVYLGGMDSSTSHIKFRQVLGVPGVSNVTLNTATLNTAKGIFDPPDAAQPNTTTDLQVGVGGAQFRDAMRLDHHVWLAAHTGCTPSGDTSLRTCIRLYQIDGLSSIPPFTPSITKEATIATAQAYNFMPAVNVGSNGNVVVVFGRSSISEYPSVYSAWRAPNTIPYDAFNAPVLIVAGTQPYLYPPYPVARWGDYFGLAVDPVRPNVLYGVGQYSTPSGLSGGQPRFAFKTAIAGVDTNTL